MARRPRSSRPRTLLASTVPFSSQSLGLDIRIVNALKTNGFVNAFPVQREVLPMCLSHRDVLVRSKTGSGKTLAYVLPCLQMLLKDLSSNPEMAINPKVHTIILVPTRELVLQVREFVMLLTKMIFARGENVEVGAFFVSEDDSIDNDMLLQCEAARSPRIVVGTPGMVYKWSKDRNNSNSEKDNCLLDLTSTKFLVVDECDLVEEYGGSKDLVNIMEKIGYKPQILMASATLKAKKIEGDLSTICNYVVKEPKNTPKGKIIKKFLVCGIVVVDPAFISIKDSEGINADQYCIDCTNFFNNNGELSTQIIEKGINYLSGIDLEGNDVENMENKTKQQKKGNVEEFTDLKSYLSFFASPCALDIIESLQSQSPLGLVQEKKFLFLYFILRLNTVETLLRRKKFIIFVNSISTAYSVLYFIRSFTSYEDRWSTAAVRQNDTVRAYVLDDVYPLATRTSIIDLFNKGAINVLIMTDNSCDVKYNTSDKKELNRYGGIDESEFISASVIDETSKKTQKGKKNNHPKKEKQSLEVEGNTDEDMEHTEDESMDYYEEGEDEEEEFGEEEEEEIGEEEEEEEEEYLEDFSENEEEMPEEEEEEQQEEKGSDNETENEFVDEDDKTDKKASFSKNKTSDENVNFARGIDFELVDILINFDVPLRLSEYIHRVGRVNRGTVREGRVINLIGRTARVPDSQLKAEFNIALGNKIVRKVVKGETKYTIIRSPERAAIVNSSLGRNASSVLLSDLSILSNANSYFVKQLGQRCIHTLSFDYKNLRPIEYRVSSVVSRIFGNTNRYASGFEQLRSVNKIAKKERAEAVKTEIDKAKKLRENFMKDKNVMKKFKEALYVDKGGNVSGKEEKGKKKESGENRIRKSLGFVPDYIAGLLGGIGYSSVEMERNMSIPEKKPKKKKGIKPWKLKYIKGLETNKKGADRKGIQNKSNGQRKFNNRRGNKSDPLKSLKMGKRRGK